MTRSKSIKEHVDIGVTSLPLLRSRLGGDSRLHPYSKAVCEIRQVFVMLECEGDA